MITVACAVWGNWPKHYIRKDGSPRDRGGKQELQAEYIKRLRDSVARNLKLPHRFICFADDVEKVPEGIKVLPLKVPRFRRAIAKAYVYGAPDTGCPIEPGTPILMFDLDTVIVGSLEPLVNHGRELVARERAYMLPNMMVDGDTVFSVAGSEKANMCARFLAREMKNDCSKTDGGDERLLLGEAGAEMWGHVCPGKVLTFKHHCKDLRKLPGGVCVVSFHGRPLPDQVNKPWVKENWR